jgi:endonuclease YncB( thermonuclease family)
MITLRQLAVFFAVLPLAALSPTASAAAPVDRESARFAACGSGQRVTCVVDGDTFWYRGEKVRIADINTPETSSPACQREAQLGAAATRRLIELLNAGPFTLSRWQDRDTDRYGRLLRVVTRRGESLGDRMTGEGLAEPWRGRRSSWCA